MKKCHFIHLTQKIYILHTHTHINILNFSFPIYFDFCLFRFIYEFIFLFFVSIIIISTFFFFFFFFVSLPSINTTYNRILFSVSCLNCIEIYLVHFFRLSSIPASPHCNIPEHTYLSLSLFKILTYSRIQSAISLSFFFFYLSFFTV